jgi:putative phosphoesterase
MKLAVISDIHGNIYALMKALEDIDEQKVDKIICLGDLVGYGPHPNEVVALIRRREIPCIKGNYDASVVDGDYTYIRNTAINSFALPWAINEVRVANKYFLDSLPTSLKYTFNGVNFLFTHGSPNAINDYLFEDAANTIEVMNQLDDDVLVCAHTHIPCAKKYGNKLLINVGSVGKPKIGKPNPTYAIIEIEDNGEVKVTFRYLEYEFKRIVKDCTMLNFPLAITSSYETGKE